ncbi:MAG: SDR family NAD(P)-dependent oxidoreductase, partial [Pseudomonadota bacterium]
MLSSVIDKLRRDAVYPELAGHRVLLTGACCDFGVDIARSFAEHDAKLIVQLGAQSPEMLSLGQILAETARDLQIFERPLLDSEAATRFLQGPAQTTFGGLELVINLVQITPDDLVGRFELDEIEDLIAEKLTPATIIGRIAANRMRLTMTDGLILNVIAAPNCRTPQEMALVDMLRATLAAMTRREAQVWGE